MKRLAFTYLLILFFLACDNSPIQSDVNLFDDSYLSDSVKYLYQLDAYRLALRDMRENDDDYLTNVEISDDLYQKCYNGLIAVLNSKYTEEIDSIKNIHMIHTWPEPRFNEIILSLEEDSILINNLRNNQLSGIHSFDSLVNHFQLELNWISSFSFNLTYWTDEINNLFAICKSFEELSVVKYAGPNNFCCGWGNDISAIINEESIEYQFHLNLCADLAGCPEDYVWKFISHRDGNVEFLGSGLQPLIP